MVGPEKDGSLQNCKAYAEQLNLNVKFTGQLTKQEWRELSNNYNIFIINRSFKFGIEYINKNFVVEYFDTLHRRN